MRLVGISVRRILSEDVIDERVHDAAGLAADASVWVDLLQHLVDGVALPPLMPLLCTATGGLCLGGGLLCSLQHCFRTHDHKQAK